MIKNFFKPFGPFFWFILLTGLSFTVMFSIAEFQGVETFTANLVGAAICAVIIGLAGIPLVLFIRWIRSWRNFRRFMVGVGCLVALVALFYAEEDWRGKHDWETYKREMEAQGEKFSLLELAPPPVPDDQNFAMTPIVASCYSWEMDRNGHRITPPNTNIVNRLEMRIECYAYDTPTNTGGSWQKAKPINLGAWQEYYRMLATKTNLFPVPPQPQSPAADVLLALSIYDPAIEQLRKASHLAFARFPFDYNSDDPSTFLMPQLSDLKGCTQVLYLRTAAELELGQTTQALADLKLEFRLIDSLHDEPFIISHLVRIAMMSISMNTLWEGLADHQWSDAQLIELDRELQKLDFLSDWQFSMRGERAYSIGMIDWLRRQRKYRKMAEMFSWDNPSIDEFTKSLSAMGFWIMPAGWFDHDELALAKIDQQWFLPTTDPEKHLAFPQIARQGDEYLASMPVRPWNYWSRQFPAGLLRGGRRFALTQSSIDLARVACALERYRLVHGNYPDSLDALTPQFVAQTPHDLIGGQPLHYRLEPDGQFVLYSIGWNEKDDGGIVVGLRETGLVDIEKGDWVWRYPAKN